MIALESEDTKQITTAIKNVIRIAFRQKVSKWNLFQLLILNFVFKRRGKSVGEEIESP